MEAPSDWRLVVGLQESHDRSSRLPQQHRIDGPAMTCTEKT